MGIGTREESGTSESFSIERNGKKMAGRRKERYINTRRERGRVRERE